MPALAAFALIAARPAAAFTPGMNDDMVPVTATASDGPPPSITLSWTTTGTPLTSATSAAYTISRRIYNYNNPGNGYAYTQIAVIPGGSPNTYIDPNITPGTIYEYRICNNGDSGWCQTPVYGFVASGDQVPLAGNRGTIDLLVDQTIASSGSCSAQLTRLTQDLVGDGWKVNQYAVPRDINNLNTTGQDATTSGTTVSAIRKQIMADARTYPDLAAVLLFGHVAIPFTGYEIPDGHYSRAMPCDGYYGDMGDNNPPASGNWADNASYEVGGNLPDNQQVDGRWDVSYAYGIPITSRKLMVGRVDFANLPAFESGTTAGLPLTEPQLLNRYLDKDHNFRDARLVAQRKALYTVNNNFYRNVLRTFYTYFGISNVVAGGEVLLWSALTGGTNAPYLCGYAGCSGATNETIGINTADMSTSDYKVIFTLAGASFMEEWWRNDNALRAMLAMPTYSLTCGWSDYSSDWQFERFAMGVPIGGSLQFSAGQYPNDAMDSYAYSEDDQYTTVWTSLMGDPTLSMYVVTPPSSLTASVSGSNAVLAWTPSPDPNVCGYNIYRGANLSGTAGFTQLGIVSGTTPTVAGGLATTYTDTTPRSGEVIYMVRAVNYENRGTGLYYNASQGQYVSLSPSGSASLPPAAFSLSGTTMQLVPALVTLSGSDPRGNPLLYSIVIHPSNGVLTGSAPNLTYTPTGTYTGTDSFTYVVNNGLADSAIATVNLTILSPGAAPAPTGLDAVSGTETGQILLNWSASGGAQGYLLQRSLNSNLGYTVIAATSGTNYADDDPSLAAGKTYYYEATAEASGAASPSSAPASATPYVPPAYAGWSYTYFGLDAPPAQAGDTASPASDGIPNLMKYALGLNPTTAYCDTSGGMPAFGITTSGSNQYLTLTFSGTAPDVTYTVEATSYLTGFWSALQSWPVGDPPGTQTVRDTVSLSSTTMRFINLKVTGP